MLEFTRMCVACCATAPWSAFISPISATEVGASAATRTVIGTSGSLTATEMTTAATVVSAASATSANRYADLLNGAGGTGAGGVSGTSDLDVVRAELAQQ